MELNEKQLKLAVREAMREILAELRPMPISAAHVAPVTEIVIRSGTPETVFGRSGSSPGGSIVPYCACQCPYSISSEAASLDDKSKKLLQRIKDKTGEDPEKLAHKLELRVRTQQLAEDIEKCAKELEIEQPE